jgi:RHS repeat-associated protein
LSIRLLGQPTKSAEVDNDVATYSTGAGSTFALQSLPSGVKETIELDNASQSTFRYELSASDGLRPVLDKDGSVAFLGRQGTIAATLPSPTVHDAGISREQSEGNASFHLRREGRRTELLVSVDGEWLHDPNRIWPVTVDPSVFPSIDSAHTCSQSEWSEILESSTGFEEEGNFDGPPHRFQCNSSQLWSGVFGQLYWSEQYGGQVEDTERVQARIKFDLSAIPAGSYVHSARLVLHSSEPSVNAPYPLSGGVFDATAKTWTIDNLQAQVSGWINNPTLNSGFTVTSANESISPSCNRSTEACTNHYIEFDGAAASADHQPTLSVVWYPTASPDSHVTSPVNGTRSARRFNLQAGWNHGGVTGVQFQTKGPQGWVDIPEAAVVGLDGKSVTWPITIAEGARKSPPIFWNAVDPASGQYRSTKYVRALLSGSAGASGYTEAVEVRLNRETGGVKDATAAVGPGSVDLLTGAFGMSRTDVSVPAVTTSLEFSRSYGSRGVSESAILEPEGVFGPGWEPGIPVEEIGESVWKSIRDFTATETVEFEDHHTEVKELGKYAVLADPQGHEYSFAVTEAGYATPSTLAGWKLALESGILVLTSPSGIRTSFSKGASSGNEYVPTTIAEAGGAGNATTMVYQLAGSSTLRLTSEVAPAAPNIVCTPVNATTTVGCRSLQFVYRSATTWGAPAADGDRLAEIVYYGPNGSKTMAHWAVAAYGYSSKGLLVEAWDPRVSPALKEVLAYDSGGHLESITPPGEKPWTLSYGTFDEPTADGRLVAIKRASLIESQPIAQTTIVYGVPLSGDAAPNQMDPSTVARWGQQDLPLDGTAIFPADQVPSTPPATYSHATIYYLNAEGQQVNLATPAGAGVSEVPILTDEYDESGNTIRELSQKNRALALAAGAGSVAKSRELDTKRVYSVDGTELQEEWGPSHQVRLEAGSVVTGRMHTILNYDAGWPGGGIDPHLPTDETRGVAISGQPSDADQRTTETKYDWTLRKPTETVIDPEGLNLKTRIGYDPTTGLQTERSLPASPGGGDAHTTKMVYYSAGAESPVAVCRNMPGYAGFPCETMPVSQPSSGGLPKVLVKRFESYSPWGAPERIYESPAGEEKTQRTILASYDTAGRRTWVFIGGAGEGVGGSTGTTEVKYSPTTGLPTAERFADPEECVDVCEPECSPEITEECIPPFDNQDVTTTYDALGRASSYEDADGNIATTTYDIDGRSTKTTDQHGMQILTYDPATGLPVKLEDSSAGTFAASYDADGNLVERVLPNGLTATTTFNEVDEPTNIQYTKGSSCGVSCIWFSESVERSVYGNILTRNGSQSSATYAYDHASRLTQVKETPAGAGCSVQEYAYDKDSNRTSMVARAPGSGGACATSGGATKTFEYDAADRLLGSGMTYDQFGRIATLPSTMTGSAALTTTYFSNDMVATQTQGSVTNSYQLDGALRPRLRVQGAGLEGTETFHYDSASTSPAWTKRGSVISRYIVGIGGEMAATKEGSAEVRFNLTNLHGDVVAVAGASPTATKLISTAAFDAYGVPAAPATSRYGWLGGRAARTELASGVIQMGARSYVPQIGRFLSPDPVSGTSNSYGYAEADPINNTDLAGTKTAIGNAVAVGSTRRPRGMVRQAGIAASAPTAAAAPGQSDRPPAPDPATVVVRRTTNGPPLSPSSPSSPEDLKCGFGGTGVANTVGGRTAVEMLLTWRCNDFVSARAYLMSPGEVSQLGFGEGTHGEIAVGIAYYGPPEIDIKMCFMADSGIDSYRKCRGTIWIDIETLKIPGI